MSKYLCAPNFDKMSPYTDELLLLPVSENRRMPYWNSISGFNFDLFIVIIKNGAKSPILRENGVKM